jgi:zinc D-Ala-D-Ala dipeptidase
MMISISKLTKNSIGVVCFMSNIACGVSPKTAPQKWGHPVVSTEAVKAVLYLPIADEAVKRIEINESKEELVDLLEVNNPRIKPLAGFDEKYANTYDGYSKVRRGVYEKLLKMVDLLPENVGIAFFEGYRPLHKQKEYFDKKFDEIFQIMKDKEKAYQETCKHVAPVIDNVPPHTTGAAIDMTLFEIKDGHEELLDMGKFDVIFGPNAHQETFSENTTPQQRANRTLLLEAATHAGLVNYGFEWWHYSYGDRAWAFVKGEKQAIYSPDV